MLVCEHLRHVESNFCTASVIRVHRFDQSGLPVQAPTRRVHLQHHGQLKHTAVLIADKPAEGAWREEAWREGAVEGVGGVGH